MRVWLLVRGKPFSCMLRATQLRLQSASLRHHTSCHPELKHVSCASCSSPLAFSNMVVALTCVKSLKTLSKALSDANHTSLSCLQVITVEGPVVSMVSQYVNLSGSTTANNSSPLEITVDVQLEGLVLAPVTATVAISQRHLVDGTTTEADLITLSWEEAELLWPEGSPGEP